MERKIGGNGKAVKREYGIDIIKIIACSFVVAIHTVNGQLGVINRIIQMCTVLAIPLFFTVNGYLLLKKPKVSYGYVVKRIIKILIICFSWEAIHATVCFLVYHEIRNFLLSFLLDFLQEGLFFHFWFFGSLIIIYLILPLINKLLNKHKIVYITILAVLCLACVVIDVLQFLVNQQFIRAIIQTFRLWMWLFYFMLGGIISRYKELVEQIFRKHRVVVSSSILLSVAGMLGWLCFNGLLGRRLDVGGFYGALPVIICVAVLLCFAVSCRFICSDKIKNIIQWISSLTMGVYIVHPLVLSIWIHFIPSMDTNWLLNCLYCLCVLISSTIIVIFIQKIPVLKELIKI